MRRAVLIFNPVSGRPARRRAQVEAAAAVLRAGGVEATLVATSAPGTAGELAAQAIASGADAVFACGGDGTVHEVLQGMDARAALGVIPLGTANSLAWDLGIPEKAEAAARAALASTPRRTALGVVRFRSRQGESASRCFIMNAGIGMDALLFYRLAAASKQRFGMSAYYVEALRQWMTARYEFFACEFTTTAGETRRERVTQAMAVRIADFGGIVGKLAPGADLRRNDMRLLLFKTARRSDYLRYTVRTALHGRWNVRATEVVNAVRLRCEPLPESSSNIYLEADGELLGGLPVEVAMASQAVMLLVPEPGAPS
jgi:YegS/Rv2252/BmrU family lipid kinase